MLKKTQREGLLFDQYMYIYIYYNKMRTDIFFEALKHTSFTSLALGRREEEGGGRNERRKKGKERATVIGLYKHEYLLKLTTHCGWGLEHGKLSVFHNVSYRKQLKHT